MSVVTEEAINIALIAYHRTRPHKGAVVAMRAAIAAVAPLIAAAERERCAREVDCGAQGMAAMGQHEAAITAWNRRATPPAAVTALVEALEAADQFIRNGIELGFIRMPDAGTPDPALKTPAMIEAALALYRGEAGR